MRSVSAPLIGVITDQKPVGAAHRPFTGSYPDYLDCIAAAGGLPVLIPLGLSTDALRGIFERVDGVLLTGGADVAPALYGETVFHEKVYGVNPLRDEAEIQVSRWAAEDDVPLFGICRGHQVVNVALGGTLIADIPSQIDAAVSHDFPDDTPLDIYAHPVAIAPGSRLAGIVGTVNLTVNSWHHQSVREAGQGLIVSAHAPDGVIEATEHPGAHFLLTVQWHPEKLYATDPAMAALFRAFVEAAARRHSETGNGQRG